MNDEKSFEEYIILYLNEIGKSLKNIEKRLGNIRLFHNTIATLKVLTIIS